jgi:hypothetical protein
VNHALGVARISGVAASPFLRREFAEAGETYLAAVGERIRDGAQNGVEDTPPISL